MKHYNDHLLLSSCAGHCGIEYQQQTILGLVSSLSIGFRENLAVGQEQTWVPEKSSGLRFLAFPTLLPPSALKTENENNYIANSTTKELVGASFLKLSSAWYGMESR